MIIHKPENERLPHEELEYQHKSKEPETIQECALLFCWECVHYDLNFRLSCPIRLKLIEKNKLLKFQRMFKGRLFPIGENYEQHTDPEP